MADDLNSLPLLTMRSCTARLLKTDKAFTLHKMTGNWPESDREIFDALKIEGGHITMYDHNSVMMVFPLK